MSFCHLENMSSMPMNLISLSTRTDLSLKFHDWTVSMSLEMFYLRQGE